MSGRANRPWRIEQFRDGAWRSVATLTTRERAEADATYWGSLYSIVRIVNRDSGQVVEVSHAPDDIRAVLAGDTEREQL